MVIVVVVVIVVVAAAVIVLVVIELEVAVTCDARCLLNAPDGNKVPRSKLTIC
jgi:hypothetical protein